MVLSAVVLTTFAPALASTVSAETMAGCPTLMPGDNVKVVSPKDRPAIYAINKNGDIVYYERGALYKEWNKNYQFIGITQACFDSLKTPSVQPFGVGYPAGTVVRRPNSDQLYLVLAGQKLALITNDAATALFGSNLTVKQEVDVNWTNYQINPTTITVGKVQPGMVFMYGGKTWYLNESSQLQEVTAAGMTANNVGGNGRTVPTVTEAAVAGFSTGAQVTSEVMWLTDVTQGTGGVGSSNNPPAGASTVTVSLASANPLATTLVSDTTNGAQTMAPVLKLRFAASGADAVVTGLNLSRMGVSADTDISNMHLYDGSTRLASNPSISNGMVKFNNSNGLFTVSKDGTREVTVLLDVKSNVSSAKTFVFGLKAPQDVVVKNGSLTSAGSFPFMGNEFRVASVTDLGKFTLTATSPTSNSTVDAGTTAFEVGRFQAQANTQDIELRKLGFTFVGSINADDLSNCSLSSGSVPLGAVNQSLSSDKTVTFDMSAAPYVLTSGQTKVLSLKCDVVKGTNRDFRVSIQNSYDVVAYDKAYNAFLMPNGTDTFGTIQPHDGSNNSVKFTVNTGNLTQSMSSSSPTGNVADDATGVTLGTFLWKANGEDVKVNSLSVSSTASVATTLKNVKLYVQGSQVGNTILSMSATGAANTNWGTFGSSFIIKAGTEAQVRVVADLTDSTVVAGTTITVGLAAGSSNAQGTISLQSISTVLQRGNTLTVRAGTVSVTKNTAFGNRTSGTPTGALNAQQAKVASFTISAGPTDPVELSSVTLADNSTTDCIGTYMQNVALKSATDGKQLGETKASPSTSCGSANSYTFSFAQQRVTIPAGGQYVVDVYADLKAAYTTANSALIKVDSVVADSVRADGTSISASVSSLNLPLQYVYISGSGSLSIALSSGSPTDNHYLMGALNQTLGTFKFIAGNQEPVTVTNLVVSNNVSTGATGTLSNIRLVDTDTNQVVATATSGFVDSDNSGTIATGTIAHATFGTTNLVIPAGNGGKVYAVVADIVGYDAGGFSSTGQTANVGIMKYYTGTNLAVTANGTSSGASITPTITNSNVGAGVSANNNFAGASTSTLYRARLSVAWAESSKAGLASVGRGPNEELGRFVITNTANGTGNFSAYVKYIDFNITTTISNTANRTLKVYADSISSAGNNTGLRATTQWYASGNQNFADTAMTDNGFTDVEIESGKSKTFIVTMDLTDATPASGNATRTLSLGLPNASIHWSDGISDTTKMSELPMQPRTFVFSN